LFIIVFVEQAAKMWFKNIILKTCKSKQSPNGRKFAQSGQLRSSDISFLHKVSFYLLNNFATNRL
jgi:hypothetical protein